MSGGFQQVPGTSGSDYQLADPGGYTGQAGQNIFGNLGQNLVNQGMGAMGAWTTPGSEPGSFMQNYLTDFGQLGNAITAQTSPLNQQLQNQMQQNISQGMAQAGQQMSGLGALRSSAMGEAAGDVVGRAATDASTQLAQAQLGLLQPLAGQQMAGRQQALAQQSALPMSMLGLQGQFGEPTYVAPQYMQGPGFMDYANMLMPGIQAVGSFFGNSGGQ